MVKRTANYLGLAAGLLALFISLGGPAWAAAKIDGSQIKKGSITGKQVKNGAIAGLDVRDGSLTAADLAAGSVTTKAFAPSAVAPAAVSAQSAQSAQSAVSAESAATARWAVTAQSADTATSAGSVPGLLPGSFTAAGGSSAAGQFSIAAGRRAKAVNTGSFVWADGSINADFTSTADNQFAIRAANGMFLSEQAGNAKAVPVGTRYRDNAIIAWARVTAAGVAETDVNVDSVTKVGVGHYKINLDTSALSGFSLIPVVTPEVDEAAGNVPPTGAANVRFAVTNQFASGNNFDVYIYNGSFASVDNDFSVVVTGR